MKNNTATAKSHLISAIKNMPADFALSEARTYLNFALSEIEKVEKKRLKRGVPQQPLLGVAKIPEAKHATISRQPTSQPWNQQQLQGAINYIDSLIQQEQQKLEDYKRQQLEKQLNQIQQPGDEGDELLQG